MSFLFEVKFQKILKTQKQMNPTIATYATYLVIAVPLTIWVARTLFHNGRVFLVECFKGNEHLADSVNRLLVVGFYLVNLGFVSLYLRVTGDVNDTRGIFETVSSKIGIVMLALGVMHFFNLLVFTRMRKRAAWEQAPPPVPHVGVVQQPPVMPQR